MQIDGETVPFAAWFAEAIASAPESDDRFQRTTHRVNTAIVDAQKRHDEGHPSIAVILTLFRRRGLCRTDIFDLAQDR